MSDQTPSPAVEPEMIPYGMKVALVCLDDGPWRAGAVSFFKERGYYLIDEPDDKLAAAKLRLNATDAVIAGQAKAEALAEMHERPGLKRRDTALFVVGDNPSLDSWAAFTSGADWVLHEADAAKCSMLLDEAIKRHEASREPWRMAEAAGH